MSVEQPMLGKALFHRMATYLVAIVELLPEAARHGASQAAWGLREASVHTPEDLMIPAPITIKKAQEEDAEEKAAMGKEAECDAIHVDEWLNIYGQLRMTSDPTFGYVHHMLSHFRKPAILRTRTDEFYRGLKLFVTYEGKTYRVTSASRMGDIGLADDFCHPNDRHYDHRVWISSKLTNWRREP